MQLQVRGPLFFSAHDEAGMFEWLAKIRNVSVTGVGPNLVFDVRRPLSRTGLRELLALFFRYQLDMRPLAGRKVGRGARSRSSPAREPLRRKGDQDDPAASAAGARD